MTSSTLKTEVVIVGGGIVGTALACALGKMDCDVILIDSQAVLGFTSATQDLRASSITYACQQWLEQLGVWDLISEKYIGAFRTMHVWEKDQKKEEKQERQADIIFDSATLGIPSLGYIVPNQILVNALFQRLNHFNSVKVFRPVHATSISFNQKSAYVTFEDKVIEAKLIVGADGAHSWVRQQCHFLYSEIPYEHTALMTRIYHSNTHQECAQQRFCNNDIIAFLPLSDPHYSALVWSASPEKISTLKSLSSEEFDIELQQQWGNSLGTLRTDASCVAIPLVERHAISYIQDRVALIGDAAHTLHPLAGQGLNLGLWDAQCLAEIILDTKNKKRDVGRYANLRRYERARRWHNHVMLKSMNHYKWLFSQNNVTWTWARQTGMRIVNQISPLKKKIMEKAVFGK